jgi:hypothetical protein
MMMGRDANEGQQAASLFGRRLDLARLEQERREQAERARQLGICGELSYFTALERQRLERRRRALLAHPGPAVFGQLRQLERELQSVHRAEVDLAGRRAAIEARM